MTMERKTIRQISLEWKRALESSLQPFYGELGNLLDDFRSRSKTLEEKLTLLKDPPVPTGEPETDAYLAAVAETLSRESGLQPPAWTEDNRYYLSRPWFASGLQSLKATLLVESPVPFRRRNLFISANALTRV